MSTDFVICSKSVTVNVVIFAGGKFRENVAKNFHVGVIFAILLIFPNKVIWALFSHGGGGIFVKKTISRKTRKLPPRKNFHISSIPLQSIIQSELFSLSLVFWYKLVGLDHQVGHSPEVHRPWTAWTVAGIYGPLHDFPVIRGAARFPDGWTVLYRQWWLCYRASALVQTTSTVTIIMKYEFSIFDALSIHTRVVR